LIINNLIVIYQMIDGIPNILAGEDGANWNPTSGWLFVPDVVAAAARSDLGYPAQLSQREPLKTADKM